MLSKIANNHARLLIGTGKVRLRSNATRKVRCVSNHRLRRAAAKAFGETEQRSIVKLHELLDSAKVVGLHCLGLLANRVPVERTKHDDLQRNQVEPRSIKSNSPSTALVTVVKLPDMKLFRVVLLLAEQPPSAAIRPRTA